MAIGRIDFRAGCSFAKEAGSSFGNKQDPLFKSCRILFWNQKESSFGNRQDPLLDLDRIIFWQSAGPAFGIMQDPLLATVRILFKKPCGTRCWKQEKGPSVATGGAGGELPEAECGTDG